MQRAHRHGVAMNSAAFLQAPRAMRLANTDPEAAELLERLLDITVPGLPQMRHGDGSFAFTRRGVRLASGDWRTRVEGTSLRYAAIVALGAQRLPEPMQQEVLGQSVDDLVSKLAGQSREATDVGDVALVCWAAAEAGHPSLAQALDRLILLDGDPVPRYVVEAAWVLAALVAALEAGAGDRGIGPARQRLLASRTGSALFPHATGPGLLPWYRAHVGCFADQVYPVQALARLHAQLGDPEAMAAADAAADRICDLQGDAGQWWWHYDARTGDVVEGYPVYSVHQHAMGPMALLEVAEAGGTANDEAIRRGLHWLAAPPETGEQLVIEELALTWRKVARGDPHKAVRATRGIASRLRPGARLGLLDRIFPPRSVDLECRPYEMGWLLHTWLR
jgi:hypothetical protein